MGERLPQETNYSDDCFGYYFHHPEPGFEWGARQLDANLRSEPTGRHFDPQLLRLCIAGDESLITHIRIRPNWPGAKHLQVVIGEVVLRDRKDKTIAAFTFGGTLEIETNGNCTRCKLSSPVPIIDRRDDDPVVQMLADESIALIARCRADWKSDVEEFERRLIQLDVEQLYVGILQELEREFQSCPGDARINTQEFLNFLHREIREAPRRLPETDPLSNLKPVREIS